MSSDSTEPTASPRRPDGPDDWQGAGEVAVLSPDLFFAMRIRTSLRQLGYTVTIAAGAGAFVEALAVPAEAPVLGIVDFNAPVDWDGLGPAMTGDVPVIAFGPHTDVAGFRAARAAGAARVVSNGEFSRTLPVLAKRHARSGGRRRTSPRRHRA
jgi:hypothetical protein